MRILHIAPTFFPATYWGGPIFSTKDICDSVSVMGEPEISLKVFTTNSSGPKKTDRLNFKEARYENYNVTYFDKKWGQSISFAMIFSLVSQVKRWDVWHLTGVFNFPTIPAFILCRIFHIPLVWSPRGAILATYDWKGAPRKKLKSIYLKFLKFISPRKLYIHSTSVQEAEACKRAFNKATTFIVPNAVSVPQKIERKISRSKIRLMFMSRLHPKKGLDILFDAMSELDEKYVLKVYGVGDESYTDHIKDRAKRFQNRIEICGELRDGEKLQAFSEADIFVLPSFSENFGIVVAEALAHGVPVITTDNTPWEFIDDEKCGLCVQAEVNAIKDAIERMSACDMKSMGDNGRELVSSRFSKKILGEKFLNQYEEAMLSGSEIG